MRRQIGSLLLGASLVVGGCATQHESLESCLKVAERGLRPIADDRSQRFLGKVREDTARCRGGERAVDAAKSSPGSTGRTTGRPVTRAACALGIG